jgi:hypothetical protein
MYVRIKSILSIRYIIGSRDDNLFSILHNIHYKQI